MDLIEIRFYVFSEHVTLVISNKKYDYKGICPFSLKYFIVLEGSVVLSSNPHCLIIQEPQLSKKFLPQTVKTLLPNNALLYYFGKLIMLRNILLLIDNTN